MTAALAAASMMFVARAAHAATATSMAASRSVAGHAQGAVRWITGDMKVLAYVGATARTLDARVRSELPKIAGLDRQLLALKFYLARTSREIRRMWAWTPAQARRFRKTAEYQQMLAEVEKVRAKFVELNPGYELRVDVDVRTLEEQTTNWNTTNSVTVLAATIMGACMKTMADTTYPLVPDAGGIVRFRKFLTRYKLPGAVTVAVPGLSLHGQLRAFDFVIIQGNRLVAGTDVASMRNVWDRPGWTTKLKDAITQSGAKFVGPLASPREPWHYSYKP